MEELTLDLGDTQSLSPYGRWRERFIRNFGVETCFAEGCELEWSAECDVLDEEDSIRFGATERDALELLARALGEPLAGEVDDGGA